MSVARWCDAGSSSPRKVLVDCYETKTREVGKPRPRPNGGAPVGQWKASAYRCGAMHLAGALVAAVPANALRTCRLRQCGRQRSAGLVAAIETGRWRAGPRRATSESGSDALAVAYRSQHKLAGVSPGSILRQRYERSVDRYSCCCQAVLRGRVTLNGAHPRAGSLRGICSRAARALCRTRPVAGPKSHGYGRILDDRGCRPTCGLPRRADRSRRSARDQQWPTEPVGFREISRRSRSIRIWQRKRVRPSCLGRRSLSATRMGRISPSSRRIPLLRAPAQLTCYRHGSMLIIGSRPP